MTTTLETPAPTTATRAESRRIDRSWTISLFGTAVGAGILFLPINAGAHGGWPLIIVTVLIAPMTYFAHRGLARFVCASPKQGEDITKVAADYFGPVTGRIITVLYFAAIYPIVLIYGVGITNTVDSLIVNQLHGPHISRVILSGVLIAAMMLVMILGQKLMLIVTQFLVYPLIVLLAGLSIYLIPTWHIDADFMKVQGVGDLLTSVWIIIPVLVFAFNHSPAISQFSLAMERAHGKGAAEHASRVLAWTAALLVIFTMTFVWSCVLSLGASGLAEARAQNLPVLSYLANVQHTPVIAAMGPLIAIAAIVSSFFGHYLGTAEGAEGIIRDFAPTFAERVGQKRLRAGIAAFIFVTTWVVAVLNPSILSLIESLSGPVIAALCYLMPMYAIARVDALARFRGRASNIFVTVMGFVAISAILYTLVN
ncbi:MAG: aromatic amino acid transport family protein [Actinomycetaceae bacterium]|nr:aromatic amino acid transport family protein [Actinomycetaceae bacterium]MDU0969419.1 aromatic amino acid transport family protein [Actinomycetaceae bacterium]